MAIPKKSNIGRNRNPQFPVIKSKELSKPKNLQEELRRLRIDPASKAKATEEANKELGRGALSSEEKDQDENSSHNERLGGLIEKHRELKQRRETEEKETRETPKVIEITNPSDSEIYSELHKGVCTVFFNRKTNPVGHIRRMTCTLDQKLFSGKYRNHPPGDSARAHQGLMPVWDLDANNWRSFYASSVARLIRNEQTDVE